MPDSGSNELGQNEANTPDFSVLVTCHFEEQSIDEFHSRLSATMESLGRSYEIIMVNDGSTDGTFEKLKEIFHKDSRVTVVMDFFKNAGQQAAITAAMCEARGRAILVMDSDLRSVDLGEGRYFASWGWPVQGMIFEVIPDGQVTIVPGDAEIPQTMLMMNLREGQ